MHNTQGLEKISRIFKGKASALNKEILKTLMESGAMYPYKIKQKLVKKDYSVINRRIRKRRICYYRQ